MAALIIGGCMIMGFTTFMSYAAIFSTPHALKVYKSLRRWIEGAMATFYCLAGLKLLASRI